MTTTAMAMGRDYSRIWLIVPAGFMLGLGYTLSPLTVLSLGLVACAARWAANGLTEGERRWYWSLLTTAISIRLIALAVLFLTADPSRPFASFFGDEELYKFRTVWLRNIGQGIAISPADVIYSYDDIGRTGHMFVLALVQAIVGDAPYGLHMLNMALYLCGVLALYRFVRPAYGGSVAMGGLIGLLLLPTLALWSISVLKEPMNVFVLVGELICAVQVLRAPRWWQKAGAAVGVAALGLAMDSLRGGGLQTAVAGTIGGILLVYVLSRGRRLLFALMALPIAITVLAGSVAVQDGVLSTLRAAAFYHSGHVLTPGYSYQLLDDHYYFSRLQILRDMPPDEAGRFAIRAIGSYFAEPLPWKTRSRAILAYLPEQMAWYGMVLLLPLGVVAGMRRDVTLTAMLVAHGVAAILIVALTGGNIGTLIRHRSLVLLYLIWLSALGAHEGVRLVMNRHRVGAGRRVDVDR